MGDAEFEDLRYEVVDHIGTITFSRPERLNAFRAATMREFVKVLDRVDADDAVRAVVVTGEGRAFCAGADISGGAEAFEPAAPKPGGAVPRDGGGMLALRIHASKKPIIAAVNGASVGMGATMTLPMDVRLASTDARFGFVFTRRGIIPEGCSSWFLPRVVGIGTASEWMLTGRLVDAPAALAAGLVRSVHPPEERSRPRMRWREIADIARTVSAAMARQLLWRMLAAENPEIAHRAESVGLAPAPDPPTPRRRRSVPRQAPPQFPGRSTDYLDVFDD
jgi:enoyl-CoA hydratase/carnithine racemase